MAQLIRSGERLGLVPALLALGCCAAYGQTTASASCAVSAVPAQVRSEGLTEVLGDLILQCSSSPGTMLTGNLTVYLTVAVTNRVNASNQALDAVLSVDYGTGFTPTGTAGVVSNSNITFFGYNVTTPASGALSLKISGIRAAAFQASGAIGQPLTASVSASNLTLNQSRAVLAYPQSGLFATLYDAGITCTGSPLPSTITLSNLFATGTIFFSTRLTEGFGTAFLVRGTGDDNGTRFLIDYTGFPANAQLYVPDMVAGSDAAVPTAGGDLGGQQSGGQYMPGSNTLLLARVQGADAWGAGGSSAGAPAGSTAVAFNTASAVPLTNGSGYVVYEVVDANNARLESAQFPTFAGIPSVTAPATAYESLSFAPVSTVMTASQTAPVPRFEALAPGPDCSILGDCQAGYFPKLSVSTVPVIQLAAPAGGPMTSQPGYIPIVNAGGGIMNWTAAVTYVNGSGWLALNFTSGQNNSSVRVFANATTLTAGIYNAQVTVDAGPLAGSVTIPVVFTVSAPTATATATAANPPASSTPLPSITSMVNAATFAQTPLVAGSLATLMGANLAGNTVNVTFDGTPATLLYTSASQINLQVPAGLALKTATSVVVTADGNSSAPVTVPLSPAWPSIFTPGVLNQDNSVNGPGAPARAGTVIQIYATGIPDGATVWASIGGPDHLPPIYAGPAPGMAGVQQVNATVPLNATSGLAGGTAPLYVCAMVNGQQFCSNTYNLAVQ